MHASALIDVYRWIMSANKHVCSICFGDCEHCVFVVHKLNRYVKGVCHCVLFQREAA